MSRQRNVRAASALLPLVLALAGCGSDAYFTVPPDALLNRYAYLPPDTTHEPPEEPYLISLCYGRQSDAAGDVMSKAEELCPQGDLTIHSQDSFWNDCALFHPVRVNLICDPSIQRQ